MDRFMNIMCGLISLILLITFWLMYFENGSWILGGQYARVLKIDGTIGLIVGIVFSGATLVFVKRCFSKKEE